MSKETPTKRGPAAMFHALRTALHFWRARLRVLLSITPVPPRVERDDINEVLRRSMPMRLRDK